MSSTSPCSYLSWDSDFFGHRIGRVNGGKLNERMLQSIFSWCQKEQIDCLYFLADADHAETVSLAEDAGFSLRDVRLTFELNNPAEACSPLSPVEGLEVRQSRPGDLEALRDTARTSYIHTRFYYDPCFSEEQCAQLYDLWLARSLQDDFASAVIVAELEGQPVGYVTCKLEEGKEGTIGLVGVKESARGLQIGQHLLYAAAAWFADNERQSIRVVTQGRNIAAQRLYQKCGFVTHSMQLWYHKWFTDCTNQKAGL